MVMIEAMDTELHGAHPAAYIEAPGTSSGFKGSYRNILDSLATCPSVTPPPEPEAELKP